MKKGAGGDNRKKTGSQRIYMSIYIVPALFGYKLSGTVEPWNRGTVEPWNGGTVEPWNGGTVELRNSGTV